MARPADPILYSFRRCPYAMRARLALAVSNTACTLREVKISAKPAAMLTASPKGTVPVLVQADGTVIDESLDIMRWALTQRDPEDWLARDDPALIARNDGAFKHDLDRYKYPERHGSDALVHRETGLAFLRALDDRLADAAQLCGPVRGLADARSCRSCGSSRRWTGSGSMNSHSRICSAGWPIMSPPRCSTP